MALLLAAQCTLCREPVPDMPATTWLKETGESLKPEAVHATFRAPNHTFGHAKNRPPDLSGPHLESPYQKSHIFSVIPCDLMYGNDPFVVEFVFIATMSRLAQPETSCRQAVYLRPTRRLQHGLLATWLAGRRLRRRFHREGVGIRAAGGLLLPK
jgi:hypothetical protein